MVEMVEILDGRLGKRSVERVRYVINNLLHLVIVKYGDISLVLCISTRLRLVTILSLLVKYLVIFHADPCNKSYIYGQTRCARVMTNLHVLSPLSRNPVSQWLCFLSYFLSFLLFSLSFLLPFSSLTNLVLVLYFIHMYFEL